MSPEMDLLDQLIGCDESLNFGLRIFGDQSNQGALERARHAITQQVKDGFVRIKHKEVGGERCLPEWEAMRVLADEANWMKRGEEAEYLLSLTQKGARYVS